MKEYLLALRKEQSKRWTLIHRKPVILEVLNITFKHEHVWILKSCITDFLRLYTENKIDSLMYNYTAISDVFGSVEHLFIPKEFSEGLSEHNRLPTHC